LGIEPTQAEKRDSAIKTAISTAKRAKHVSHAINILLPYLKEYPTEPSLYVQLGHYYAEIGDKKSAILSWEKASLFDPQNHELHFNLGSLLHSVGNRQQAKEAYGRALLLNSNFPEAYMNLGLLFVDMNMLFKAIVCFQTTIKLLLHQHGENDKLLAKVYASLGDVYSNARIAMWEKACQVYEKSLVMVKNPDVMFQLARIYYGVDEVMRAKVWFDRAIRAGCRELEAYARLGDIMNEGTEKEKEKAIELYTVVLAIAVKDPEKAKGLVPSVTHIFLHLGVMLYEQVEYSRAASLLGEVVNRNDNPTLTATALTFLGDIEKTRGNADTAIDYYRASLRFKREVEVYETLSQLYFDIGEAEEGGKALLEAISIDPERGWNMTRMARLYLELGQEKKGIEMATKCVEGSKRGKEGSHFLLGRYHYENEEYEKARHHLRHSLHNLPDINEEEDVDEDEISMEEREKKEHIAEAFFLLGKMGLELDDQNAMISRRSFENALKYDYMHVCTGFFSHFFLSDVGIFRLVLICIWECYKKRWENLSKQRNI